MGIEFDRKERGGAVGRERKAGERSPKEVEKGLDLRPGGIDEKGGVETWQPKKSLVALRAENSFAHGAVATGEAPSRLQLAVRHLSQIAPGGSGAGWDGHWRCGPTSAAIVAHALGIGRSFSEARLIGALDRVDGAINQGTSNLGLEEAFRRINVAYRQTQLLNDKEEMEAYLQDQLGRGRVLIATVNSSQLPWRRNPGHASSHFIVYAGMQDGKLTTYDPNDDPAFQRPRDEPSADDGLPQRAHGLTLREASALWEDERKPAFIAIDGSAWRAPLRSDEIAKGGTYYLNGWVSKSRTVRGSAPFSRAPEVKLVVSKDRRAARVSIPGLGQRELALQALGQGVTRAGASYTSSLDGRAPDMELELRDGGPDVGVTHFRLRWGDWGDPGTFHLTGADVTASPVNRFGPARDASQLPP